MSELKTVAILGKGNNGRECPFDQCDEIWGVNNVLFQPEYSGIITSIKLVSGGSGYTSPPILAVEGDGQGVQGKVDIKDGAVSSITLMEQGRGFSLPPKIVLVGGGGSGAEAIVTVSPKRKIHKIFAFDILPPEYTNEIKQYAPIVSWQDYATIKYPFQEVIDSYKTEYFTNTISYMIALAGYWKIPKLHIYGVDVTFGAPYAQENRGVEYWIGRAQERGVEVIVPPNSHLLRTVSGAMYGRIDHCNMLLYLHERINLINELPRRGYYSDSLKAQNAWWVLFPKEDEAKAHNIKVHRSPDGTMGFECPVEYLSDVHMPPETWEFLRGILRNLETKGILPFSVISAYEKLILSKPEGGN